MDMFRFSPPMARLDIDPVETKRVIALSIAHGTPEVRRSVEDFQSALLDIAFGHGLISAPSTLEGYYTALEGRTMQDVIEAKRRVEDCVHSELIG